eukprot:scaffold2959_cov388-Prasinococcus_capsulatus_cf.AAC.1
MLLCQRGDTQEPQKLVRRVPVFVALRVARPTHSLLPTRVGRGRHAATFHRAYTAPGASVLYPAPLPKCGDGGGASGTLFVSRWKPPGHCGRRQRSALHAEAATTAPSSIATTTANRAPLPRPARQTGRDARACAHAGLHVRSVPRSSSDPSCTCATASSVASSACDATGPAAAQAAGPVLDESLLRSST